MADTKAASLDFQNSSIGLCPSQCPVCAEFRSRLLDASEQYFSLLSNLDEEYIDYAHALFVDLRELNYSADYTVSTAISVSQCLKKGEHDGNK
jgi:hypothetical protein